MAYTGVIADVRSSASGVLSANQRPDIDTVLRLIKPYQTPLMQWLFFSNKQSKVVLNKNSKFSWFEDEYLPHQTPILSTAACDGYTIPIVSADAVCTHWKLNDLIYIEPTDELAYVSTVTTQGSSYILTSVTSASTQLTALTAAHIGGYLKVVGSWNLENNSTPTFMSTQEVEVYSYCTIFLEGVASTGRDQAGKNYTDGKTHDEEVMKKMEEMKLQYERNFLFSNQKLSVGGTTATQRTLAMGLKGFFTTNIVPYEGAVSEEGLDAFFSTVFAKGSTERTFVVGNTLFNGITKVAKDKQGSFPAVIGGSFGGRIHNYIAGEGDVKIVRDSCMDGKFASSGFIFQEDQVIPRHMGPDKKGARKFRLEAGVETPGTDRTETKLLADIGMQVNNQELGGYYYQP